MMEDGGRTKHRSYEYTLRQRKTIRELIFAKHTLYAQVIAKTERSERIRHLPRLLNRQHHARRDRAADLRSEMTFDC